VKAIGADRKEGLTQEASDIRHQKLEKQTVKGTVYIVGY